MGQSNRETFLTYIDEISENVGHRAEKHKGGGGKEEGLAPTDDDRRRGRPKQGHCCEEQCDGDQGR